MKKILAVVVVGSALVLTGCGQAPWADSMKDYEQAVVTDPDQVTIYNNVDLHPNLSRSCLDGVAFVTTTREYGDAFERVPEWDDHCESVDK